MIKDSVSIVYQILSILLGIFSTYIIFDFLKRFNKTIHYKKYIYIVAYIIFTSIMFKISNMPNEILRMMITIICTVFVGHFLYNNKKIFILYYSIFIVILFSSQVIITSLFDLSFYYLENNFSSIEVYLLTLSTITQFFSLIISRFLIICFKNKRIQILSKKQYLNFLILPLFSTFYMVTLLTYVSMYMSVQDITLLIVNFVSIIILNIFITNIFQSISRNNELKNEVILYENQAKMQYDYYSTLESKYKNSRKLIHDMKNHLNTIEELYKINEGDKAKTYTEDMYLMMDKLSQKYYTDNKVLNILLNDKVQKGEEFNIKFICKIGDANLDFIKDIDLTTIFANLLDNAIEGSKDVLEERVITLKIDKFNQFIVINIINNISKIPIKDKKYFKSSKKNHKGLGIQNVNIALEKYEGNMRIDYDNKTFKVNIIIPIS